MSENYIDNLEQMHICACTCGCSNEVEEENQKCLYCELGHK